MWYKIIIGKNERGFSDGNVSKEDGGLSIIHNLSLRK